MSRHLPAAAFVVVQLVGAWTVDQHIRAIRCESMSFYVMTGLVWAVVAWGLVRFLVWLAR